MIASIGNLFVRGLSAAFRPNETMNSSSKDGTPVDQESTTCTSAGKGTAGGTDYIGIIDPREVTVAEPPSVGEPRETSLTEVQGIPMTRQLGARCPLPFGLHCDWLALRLQVSEVGLDGGF